MLRGPYQNKRVTPHTKVTVVRAAGGLIYLLTAVITKYLA